MKIATVLHNPDAGDEDFSKKELINLLEGAGFECRYFTTKKNGWKDFDKESDFLVIAGGDGTVRKVAKKLVKKQLVDKKFPIGLLPLGTANNIAKSLGICEEPDQLITSWDQENVKLYDVGRIEGITETKFFLEGFGYGIFPRLMKEMKSDNSKEKESPDDAIKMSLEKLHAIILNTNARQCDIEIDGVEHSGKYISAEILNTRSIGPNLFLAPDGDPGDGYLDVVLIPDSQKQHFADYVQHKLNGIDDPFIFNPVRAKSIKVRWHGTHMHVDDELIKLEAPLDVAIEIQEGVLKFLVPPTHSAHG